MTSISFSFLKHISLKLFLKNQKIITTFQLKFVQPYLYLLTTFDHRII